MLIAVALAATTAAASVPNDQCGGAIAIPTTAFPTTTANVDLAQVDAYVAGTSGDPAWSCDTSTGRRVWYSFTPTQSAIYRVSTCGSGISDSVIEVFDGVGGCGAAPVPMQACNDDMGTSFGSCTSNLSTVQVPMQAGRTYYVVAGAFSSTSGNLAVTVDKLPNAVANDVCQSAAIIPGTLTAAVTLPAVDLASATSTADAVPSCDSSTVGGVPTTGGVSSEASRGVWYSFTPTASGPVLFDLCSSSSLTGPAPAGTLSIFTSSNGTCGGTFTEVGGACATSTCGSFGASQINVTNNTTYYVLAYQGNQSVTTTSLVQLKVSPPPSNDVCTAAIDVPENTTVDGTTTAAANNATLDGGSAPYAGTFGNTTSSSAPGRDVVYSFRAGAAGNYSFRFTPALGASFSNPIIYLTDEASCPASGIPTNVIAAANRSSSATVAEEMMCVPLSNGQTVYAYIDDTSSTATGGAFDFEVTKCVREQEPNYGPAEANAFVCGIEGTHLASGDYDTFSIGTPAVNSKIFAIVDGFAAGSNTDFDLRVTDSTAVLEYDDVGNDTRWGGSSGNICGVPANGNNLFVRVNYWSSSPPSTTTSEPYRVYAVTQPPLASALMETEPNDAIPDAGAGALNYFYGDIPANGDGGISLDSDVYAFVAQAGQLVHLGLDGDPGRDLTSFNGKLELLNKNGVVLATANDTTTTVNATVATTLDAGNPQAMGEALTYRIRSSGTYYVRVSGGGTGTTRGGDYLLSIARDCVPGGGITAPGSVDSFVPTQGSTLGGTALVVTGTGFVDGARLRVGGNFAPMTAVLNATTINALTPAGVPGAATVEVVNPGGQATSASGTFLYVLPPAITDVSPKYGTSAGGTPFTITGSSFTGTPVTVTFGGTPAATMTVASPTQITGTTPAHAAGTVDVTVTTEFGSYTSTAAFTFLDAPTMSSVQPATGPTAGGNTLTINGTGFVPNASIVKIDGAVVAQSATGSATQLFVIAPAHAAGFVTVEVVNPDNQVVSVPNAYKYLAPPDATAIAPQTGTTLGGETVTITGSNFDSNATIWFDGVQATNVVVAPGGGSLTATTPGHGPGVVDVVVRNADLQEDTLVGAFTYATPNPPPVATSITPDTGTTYGGQSVTIAGSAFLPGATVTFGGTAATNVVVAATGDSITATTPAHAFGAVTVTVKNPDNQTVDVPQQYTYVAPAPTVANPAIAPASGRTTTTTNITITGDDFLTGATVDLGGAACTNVVVTKTTITCTAQPHAAGLVTLTITNPDTKSVTQANAFEYIPAPTIVGPVVPNSGPTAGGTSVVITGTGFRTGATVRFGTNNSTNVTVNSATQITAISPPGAAGTVGITVTNTDNQTVTLASAFQYFAPPTITAINPAQGFAAGGTAVTITGTAFRAGVTVKFVVGGVSQNGTVGTVTATSIAVTTPAHTPGLADVIVTNVDGQTVTLAGAFRFVAAPTATTVAPNHGPITGGTRIAITGTDFTTGATVRLGGTPAFATVVSNNGTTLSATTNAHAAGAVDVTVTNPDGQTVTLSNAFTFDPAPVLTSVSPTTGPAGGGTAVTLTGTGFLANATVNFGTTAGTVTNVTATSITVTSPAHAAGIVPVTVTNPDGQSASLGAAFTFVAAPTLASLTPTTGPTVGGTLVTLTGTGFVPNSTVTFGGVAAQASTVLSATSIEALTPAHAADSVDVVVTTPDGKTATLAGGFTYQPVAPVIDQITPSSGSTAGGTIVTITGSNFATGATVTFGSDAAASVTVVSGSLLRAVTPAHAAGTVTVVLANADGQQVSQAAGFTFVTPTSPNEGIVTDGGTGGVTGEDPNDTDVIRPASSCGCSAGSSPVFGLFALGALLLLRRRRA